MGRRRNSWPGSFFAAALAFFGLSFVFAAEESRLAEYASIVRPARATLRSVEVKRWLPDRENWAPMGTFDVVSGGHRGTAEGNLVPASFYRKQSRGYQMSRADAERFVPQWPVGRTYDGFIGPERLDVVFFDPVPVEEQRKWKGVLRVLAAVSLTLAVLTGRRRKA